MASVITAGTASNTALNLTGDTSGELQLKTNNGSTTAMTLTTGGNVGIGTSSPSVRLQVTSSSAGEAIRITNGTTAQRLHLYTGNATNTSRVEAQNGDLQLFAYDAYATTFGTNNTERMRIDSSGNVGIGTNSPSQSLVISSASTGQTLVNIINTSSNYSWNIGVVGSAAGLAGSGSLIIRDSTNGENVISTAGVNRTIALQGATSTTGVGITFPATQNASSNANTLDDYEEGTWTPSLVNGGTITTNLYGGVAAYTKVGRLVTITFGNAVISGTPNNSNAVYITGLPFVPATSQSCGTFGYVNNASTLYCGFFVDGGSLAFGARDGDYLVRNSALTSAGLQFAATVTYIV